MKIKISAITVLFTFCLVFSQNNQTEDKLFQEAEEYFKQKKYDDAIQKYTDILSINQKNNQVLLRRSAAKIESKDYYGSLNDINKYLETQPPTAETYFIKAVDNEKLDDINQAFKNYDKAIELDPNNARYYNNRGALYFSLERYKKALLDFNKAIELNPNYEVAYYNRGNCYYNMKKQKETCLDWSKAGELGIKKVYESIKEYCK